MESELQLLVVEDDPLDAKAVRRMLIKGGVLQKTDTAASLLEAKEKIHTRHYDAVILDLGLPDSQGIDSVIDFQASAPELPIVVLTGSRDDGAALKAVDIGAEDFINKDSLQPESLLKALRFAVERHRRKRELYKDMDSLRLCLDDALEEASTDPLTGLPNRRGLSRFLDRAARPRPGRPLIVGVADLDSFRQVNESRGMGVGDAVLKEFAARLQHCLRGGDFAARVGGDEFVIVFEDLVRGEAESMGRRIISHVASTPASLPGDGAIAFTATLAMAELEPPFLDLEQILLQTHQSMARAKAAGKNQVLCAWGPSSGTSSQAAPGPLPPQAEEDISLHLRGLHPLGQFASQGAHIRFSPSLNRTRPAGRLGELTLECLRLAQQWREREAPGTLLHLDVAACAFKPQVCSGLGGIFRSVQERAASVLFFDADFQARSGGASLSALRLLRQAGFPLGVRGLGQGATMLETLLQIRPEWIRFDPALTTHVGRFEEKYKVLELWLEMLRPLGCLMAAEEAGDEDDFKALERLGFAAAYTDLKKPRSRT